MLITSGIVLNCIIFGALFRPLEPVKAVVSVPMKVLSFNLFTNWVIDPLRLFSQPSCAFIKILYDKFFLIKSFDNYSMDNFCKKLCKSFEDRNGLYSGVILTQFSEIEMFEFRFINVIFLSVHQDLSKNGKQPVTTNNSNEITITNGFGRPHSVSNVNHAKDRLLNGYHDTSNVMRVALSQPILNPKGLSNHGSDSVGKTFGSGVMNRRDIFYQGSMENVRKRSWVKIFSPKCWEILEKIWKPQIFIKWTKRLMIVYGSSGSFACSDEYMMRRRASVRSLPNGTVHKPNESTDCHPCAGETLAIFYEMLELSLLKDPLFLLFTLSNFCTSIGFNVPYVYLVVRNPETFRYIPTWTVRHYLDYVLLLARWN